MSERVWTSSQRDAIDVRDRSVIVSAAAGSGKTAVLVQRVIERITDTTSPCSIDKMLVVTFTRAAANEMRSRINAQLSKEIAKNPNNIYLQRQQMLLPTANISTIDSFCSTLVRENFNLLGISPDIKMADNAQTNVLKIAAADEVIENMYQNDAEGFAALTDSLTSNKNDSVLTDVIIKLFDCVRAHPFPQIWLDEKLGMFDPSCTGFADFWLSIIKIYAADMIYDCLQSAKEALDLASLSDVVSFAYGGSLQDDCEMLENMYYSINSYNQSDITAPKFCKLSSIKKCDDENALNIKNSVQKMRNEYKKQCFNAYDLLCIDIDRIRTQNSHILPIIKALFTTLSLFSKTYSRMKAEKQICDFGDLLHYSLRLLTSIDSDGNITYTDTAKQLSEQFDEILIDEYQDTNFAQDTMFRAISRNGENLFMVGDVKQSIYRFRQAMPRIFLEKLFTSDDYEKNKAQHHARIMLDRNFRSRIEVIDSINMLFECLMKKDFCGIEYDDSHSLKAGAEYPKSDFDCTTEVVITDCYNESESVNTDMRDIYEARSIGYKIRSMIESGFTVTQNGVQRRCTYGDFCILLPTAKNKAYKYFNELNRQGIPVWTQGSDSLFDKIEVRQFIAYLKILDNPLQDIELVTALHSPLFSFSDDEILSIRKKNKDVKLFLAIKEMESENEKCADFLKTYHRHRDASGQMPVRKLADMIFEDTCYPQSVRAVYSQSALENLYLFVDCINDFEQSGHKGLSRLLRYLGRIEKLDNTDFNSASGISDGADVVKIMTIHKSKGLEFPICIIADTNRKFNKSTGAEKLLFHPDAGIGIISKDSRSLEEFRHVSWLAIKILNDRDEMSERLRVLYVAMTRACEHVIFSICTNDFTKLAQSSVRLLDSNGSCIPYRMRQSDSYAQWILSYALRQENASDICSEYSINVEPIRVPAHKQWHFECLPCCDVEDEPEIEAVSITASDDIISNIRERLSYCYPHTEQIYLPAKITASGISHGGTALQYTAQRVPDFAMTGRLNAAQRGTALHLFLQCADLSGGIDSIAEQKALLKEKGIMSDAQINAIDDDKIISFLSSDVYAMIMNADKVCREYSFSAQIPMKLVSQLPDIDELVVLQGTIDCLIIKNGEITIIDYKSDRVNNMNILTERYSEQLNLYKLAAERIFKLPVKQYMIYSIEADKSVIL